MVWVAAVSPAPNARTRSSRSWLSTVSWADAIVSLRYLTSAWVFGPSSGEDPPPGKHVGSGTIRARDRDRACGTEPAEPARQPCQLSHELLIVVAAIVASVVAQLPALIHQRLKVGLQLGAARHQQVQARPEWLICHGVRQPRLK